MKGGVGMAASSDPQLNNKYMEYVVALAQHQTVSAAAEAMFISQPAMSHFIRSLENRLGVKLFNRVRNRYIPTYEGERYLFYARRIIALETQMRNEFAEIRVAGHGQIRLALPTLRSAYILPSLVPAYRRLYPNVKLVTLEKMLLSGEADFAILNSPAKNSDTTSLFIRRDEILLAVPPDHPQIAGSQRRPDSPFDTIDIRLFREDGFILQYPDQRTRQTADHILQDVGLVPHVVIQTRSIESALKMVSQGVGICFAPETYIRQLDLCPPPRCFSLGSPHSVYDLSLAYRKNTYLPVYFQDFIQVVKQSL